MNINYVICKEHFPLLIGHLRVAPAIFRHLLEGICLFMYSTLTGLHKLLSKNRECVFGLTWIFPLYLFSRDKLNPVAQQQRYADKERQSTIESFWDRTLFTCSCLCRLNDLFRIMAVNQTDIVVGRTHTRTQPCSRAFRDRDLDRSCEWC